MYFNRGRLHPSSQIRPKIGQSLLSNSQTSANSKAVPSSEPIRKMPYNLRPRRPVRDIPVPRRGDRVSIFWSNLEAVYSGRLTRYDPVYKTFLVIYDHTPRGFDDHRIWEALDLVSWKFDHGLRWDSDNDSEQEDQEEVDEEWFQPGELGTAHPQFRADQSAVNSDSDDDSETDESDQSDEDDDEGGSDRNVPGVGNDNRARESDEDDDLGTHEEHVNQVIIHENDSQHSDDEDDDLHGGYVIVHENDSQKPSDDEDREAGDENLSGGTVGSSADQREPDDEVRQQQDERSGEQVQFDTIQKSERDHDSESSFESSLKDTVGHPPLASKILAFEGGPSKSAAPVHSQAGVQIRRRRKLQIGNTKRPANMREKKSPNSLHHPQHPQSRQAQRRLESQQVGHFDQQAEQEVRFEQKRNVNNTGESANDSGTGSDDRLCHPPPARGQRAKRLKRSQSTKEHNKKDRTVRQENDSKGSASQHDQHGNQTHFSPHTASHIGTEKGPMDSSYYPPSETRQQKASQESSLRAVNRSAIPIGASNHEQYDSRESPHNRRIISSKQVPTRNSRGLLQKLQMKRITRSQHDLGAPQEDSTGIFEVNLSEIPVSPHWKILRRNASSSAASYPRLAETEHEPIDYERRTQQDAEDTTRGNPPHVPPIPHKEETIRNSAGDSANPHFFEKRESELTSKHVFKKSDYCPNASVGESTTETAVFPTEILAQQGRDPQTTRDPRKGRRYVSFGPSGFIHFSALGNAEHQQSTNPVQSYQRDTVHINVSREMQERNERRLSHDTNHDSFRVFTGHHVPHSDMPSVEDQIKSIVETMGVSTNGSNNRRSP